jgi:hypothetical protein
MNRILLGERDGRFWFSFALFANKWGFKPQQELALTEISELDEPAFAIATGRLCGKGAGFLAPHFAKMFGRSLTLQEGQAMGVGDVVLLIKMQIYHNELSRGWGSVYAQAVLEGSIEVDDKNGFERYLRRWSVELTTKAFEVASQFPL